jgi:hypothetical protein
MDTETTQTFSLHDSFDAAVAEEEFILFTRFLWRRRGIRIIISLYAIPLAPPWQKKSLERDKTNQRHEDKS